MIWSLWRPPSLSSKAVRFERSYRISGRISADAHCLMVSVSVPLPNFCRGLAG